MRLSAVPRLADKLEGDKAVREAFTSVWNDLGRLLPSVDFIGVIAGAPDTPPAQTYYVYVDSSDSNKLKAKGPSGTVTTIASP